MNNQWHIQYLVSTWVSISWSSSDLISIFSTLGFLTFLNTRQPQIQYSFSSWPTCNTVIPFQPCLSHKRLGERLRGVWGGAGGFTGADIWRGCFEGTAVKRDTNISSKKWHQGRNQLDFDKLLRTQRNHLTEVMQKREGICRRCD